MSAEQAPESGSTFRVLPAVAMTVGGLIIALSLLFLPYSLYGVVHTGAIGVSIFLSGMVWTRWAATRWNISPADQRKWSRSFLFAALLLTILWILLNSFGPIDERER